MSSLANLFRTFLFVGGCLSRFLAGRLRLLLRSLAVCGAMCRLAVRVCCAVAAVSGASASVLFYFFAFAFRRVFCFGLNEDIFVAPLILIFHSFCFYLLVDLICVVTELQLLVRSAWTDCTRLTRVWCKKKKNLFGNFCQVAKRRDATAQLYKNIEEQAEPDAEDVGLQEADIEDNDGPEKIEKEDSAAPEEIMSEEKASGGEDEEASDENSDYERYVDACRGAQAAKRLKES
jgi:hypothetical protein